MKETLGRLIQRRMKDVGITSKAELARRLGISSAYAGDLANDTGKTKDGIYMPSPEIVGKLIDELQVSENEVLSAIGYASQTASPEIPESVKEAFAREGKLTKKDEILLAGMIETLKKQNQETEETDKQEANRNENTWKVTRRNVR